MLLPYGRTQESEADIIGLRLMSQAGFDPHQAIEVWNNMSAANSGKAPPEWMSTHPSDQTRIQNISSRMSEVWPMYQSAQNAGKRPHCSLK